VRSVGTVLLSMADAKRNILVVNLYKFLTLFLDDPSFSTMCSNCFMRIMFCTSCLLTWWAMVALRRLSTPA
jgi:hypothetical protein